MQKSEETIHGDRRKDRRYQIFLELRWKLIRRRKVLFAGEGRTLDVSSSGLLFDAGRILPAGLNVELSVAWPALLREEIPLQLVIGGRIVRTQGNLAGIRIVQHEFKTLAGDARRIPSSSLVFSSARNPGAPSQH
jgi:hypothetical protein